MTAKRKADVAEAVRRPSGRSTVQPQRFRPASSDLPNELQELIHQSATAAVGKSSHPFEAVSPIPRAILTRLSLCLPDVAHSPSQDAVVALEEALEPMLEALCAAALEHAQSQGREEILEEDLRAVSKKIMAKK